MPLLFAPFLLVMAAACFRLAGGDRSVFSPYLAFSLLVFLPLQAMVQSLARDWSFLYLLPQAHGTLYLEWVWLVGSGLLGLVLIHRMETRGLRAQHVLLAALGLLLGAVLLLGPRMLVVGTHQQFHNRFGLVSLRESYLRLPVAFSVLTLLVAMVWTVWSLTGSVGSSFPSRPKTR